MFRGPRGAGRGRDRNPAATIENLSFGKYSKKFDDGEWLSADVKNNAAYHSDRFCGFTCSNRFYADFFRGLKSLYTRKYIAGLPKDLPLLLVSGKNDPVGDMGKGVKKLYAFYTKRAKMKNVSLVLFDGSRHEFLNEEENLEEKRKTLLAFFQKNCASEKSGEE